MNALDQAIETLKVSGYKTTGKRQKILEVLYLEDKYLSAKEVQDRLKETFPAISQDTIYRNLHTFVDLNVLEETELQGEKLFRSNCEVHGHHHHFICTECGKTKELEMCPLDQFENQLLGCEVTSHRFELFGKCDKCMIA